MIKAFERVALTVDQPEDQLQAGDVGVVVDIYKDPAGFALEIFSADGTTLAVVSVEAAHVRPVSSKDVLCVREWSA
jgi:hypothetical protein